jgi:hypothetical protein
MGVRDLIDGIRQSASASERIPELELVLDGRRLIFRTPAELGVALRPRTEVTAVFARQHAKLGREVLTLELEQTRKLHRRLSEALLWCFETGEPIGTVWREAESVNFLDEHQWHPLLRGLGADGVPDQYRRVGLVRFIKYLESRLESLGEALKSVRPRQEGAPVQGSGEDRSDKAERQAGEDLSFTSVKRSVLYRRLPAHRAVEVTLGTGEAVPLYLAHLRVRLVANEEGWQLSDDQGLEVTLQEGRVIVGRADDCDVVLLGAPLDVSRYHLAIECAQGEVRLIDLSSQGTYLPRRALLETPSRH